MRLIGINVLKTSGLRRLAVVAALAAGSLLALAVMPGCGLDCPTPEQKAYLNEAEEWAERTEAGMGELHTLLGEVESRPELVLDEGWRGRLKRVLDELNYGHEEMMNVKVPAGVGEVHRAVVRVAETAMDANELLWQGAVEVNAELTYEAAAKMNEGTHLLEEVGAATKRLCQ